MEGQTSDMSQREHRNSNLDQFGCLFAAAKGLLGKLCKALPDPRAHLRTVRLGIGMLVGGGGPLTHAIGYRKQDWSADYRVFSKTGWHVDDLFRPLIRECASLSGEVIFAAQDDFIVHKSSPKISSYARDPLGPKFRVNFILAQRFTATSLLARPTGGTGQWRSVPVACDYTPPVPKAGKLADEAEVQAVRELRKKQNSSVMGSDRVVKLRAELDALPGGRDRELVVLTDGGFANKRYLTAMPGRTTTVQRFRRDARLRELLPERLRTGNAKYGATLETPEQYLKNETVPFRKAIINVGNHQLEIRFKVRRNIAWQYGTKDKPVTVVSLAPTPYRRHKNGKVLYRQPAFLLITGELAGTENETKLLRLIEAYFARFEIEGNFRDLKQGLALGKAQVWNKQSIRRAPAFTVACYSCLLLASIKCSRDLRTPQGYPSLPKWRKRGEVRRPSINDLMTRFKTEAQAWQILQAA
jgi:hypothetical protein